LLIGTFIKQQYHKERRDNALELREAESKTLGIFWSLPVGMVKKKDIVVVG